MRFVLTERRPFSRTFLLSFLCRGEGCNRAWEVVAFLELVDISSSDRSSASLLPSESVSVACVSSVWCSRLDCRCVSCSIIAVMRAKLSRWSRA